MMPVPSEISVIVFSGILGGMFPTARRGLFEAVGRSCAWAVAATFSKANNATHAQGRDRAMWNDV
jgi:hypothetical protein